MGKQRSMRGPAARGVRGCARALATPLVGALLLALPLAGLGAPAVAVHVPGPAPRAAQPPGATLYLVTLRGPGTAGVAATGPGQRGGHRLAMLRAQDRVLGQVGAPRPAYRWTTALNGFAVRLSVAQASRVGALPQVAAVEPNAVRPLAGARHGPARPAALPGGRGGAGAVVGVVDSGVDAGSPLFADAPGLGGKVVEARWYVEGYGRSRLRQSSSLSPRDDSGHGTLVASVAVGNAGVSVRVGSQRLAPYSGVAPRARLAVYKACWTAPDPADDGCATADLVTAVDQATADRVDVLTLAVAGDARVDTVDRALLGATEAGVFVAAAAGNDSRRRYAAHPVPWVTTVGASVGAVRGGELRAAGRRRLSEPVLSGAMHARRSVTGRLVLGTAVAARGATYRAARLCRPGSLDAARIAGAIVVCERGAIGRVDKSATVALADGAGMVLTDRRSVVHADLHRVPTLHLAAAQSRRLERWMRARPGARVTLSPTAAVRGGGRVLPSSATGDPRGGIVKPDVTAPGVDVLGAVPPTSASGARWGYFSGTSAATAQVSGQAAVLRSRHPGWSPARILSALVTTARPLASSSALRKGSGRTDLQTALRPGLVYDVTTSAYRRYLVGDLAGARLNTPSIKLAGPGVVRRTVTHVGRRALYYSSRAGGFADHRVRVTPAAIRVPPGGRRTFTVTVSGRRTRGVDSGWVAWRGADGTRVRIPVVITD